MKRHFDEAGRRTTLVGRLAPALAIGAMVACGQTTSQPAPAVATQAAAIWTSTSSPVGGPALGDPAVSSRQAGKLDLFYRGTDGVLHQSAYDSGSGQWQAQQSIGNPSANNPLSSDPAVVTSSDGRIDLFARDSTGHLAHRLYSGGQWYPWELDPIAIVGKPAVASPVNGSIFLFVRDAYARILVRTFSKWSGWSDWSEVANGVTSDPAAVSWGPNRVDLFAQSSTDHLLHWTWNPTIGWAVGAAEDLGGEVMSAPAATSSAFGKIDVFARDGNNALTHCTYATGGCTWETLSAAGTFVGNPAAVSWGPGRTDVLLRDGSSAIRQFVWFDSLGVPLFAQETPYWCWAAVTQMVSKFFGIDVRQCAEADWETGRVDCCSDPMPEECLRGAWPRWNNWGMTYKQTDINDPLRNALSLDEVKTQLVTKGKPFTFAWGWIGGNSGHVLVAVDYLRFAGDDWLMVNDTGGYPILLTYSAFVSGPDYVHWSDDYDIAPGRAPGHVFVSRSLGNRFIASTRWSSRFCGSGTCELADVTGDGRPDVVAFDHQIGVAVARSTGTSFEGSSTDFWLTSFCSTATDQCLTGDVDGDRKADVISFDGRGTVKVGISTGTSFVANTAWQTSLCQTGESCTVGDFNGDGKTDLIALLPDGQTRVALSTGAGFAAAQSWGYFRYCFGSQPCKVADLNGDGWADLIGFTSTSPYQAYVAMSGGIAFGRGLPAGSWSGSASDEITFGDVDGDSMADMVTFDRTTGNVSVGYSIGWAIGSVIPLAGVEIGGPTVPGTTPDLVRVADVNGDGLADAVVFARY